MGWERGRGPADERVGGGAWVAVVYGAAASAEDAGTAEKVGKGERVSICVRVGSCLVKGGEDASCVLVSESVHIDRLGCTPTYT